MRVFVADHWCHAGVGFFNNANTALRAGNTAASSKAFVYRCINYILATMQQNYSVGAFLDRYSLNSAEQLNSFSHV